MGLKDSLSVNIFILRVIGLWPIHKTNFSSKLYRVYGYIMALVWMITHTSFLVGNMVVIWGNIDEMATGSFVFLIKAVAFLKGFFFLYNFELILSMVNCLESTTFAPKNQEQDQIVNRSLRLWKVSNYTFQIMTSAALCLWFTYPVLDHTIHQKRLPFSAWYPFDYKKYPLYQLTYAHQCLSAIYISCVNVSLDGLFAGLMAHVTAQCNLLIDNFNNMDNPATEERLLELVHHHQEILKYSDNVKHILSSNSFAQFVSSVIMICTTLLHLTLVAPFTTEFFTSIIYLTCVFVQLFTYCWFGDEVRVQSSKIPTAAFQCEWLNSSISFKKNLIFFIRRTQTPIKIYALDFFELSVDTFTTIVRTSWSYFVVLRQMQTEQI